MIRWRASARRDISIEIALEDVGLGWIDLYEIDGSQWISLKRNASVADPLVKTLPPKTGWRDMAVKVINASHDHQGKPVSVSIRQAGAIIAADDGFDPINGPGPYSEVRFDDPADWNTVTYYYFSVLFS
jgi:ABC-type uncharacterized transport system YnjBCD substrate-binding protein